MNTDPTQVRRVLDGVHEFLRDARQERQDGWHIALYDPNQLLAAFDALKLRDGWKLAAYHRTAGGNGRGMGLVVPDSAKLPEVPRVPGDPNFPIQLPGELTGLVTDYLEPVKKPDAYWQASLFVREFFELVPFWHDSSWHDEAVLLDEPADAEPPAPDQEAPESWAPTVEVTESGAVVRFHSFCFRSVRQHTDRWTRNLDPDGWQPYSWYGNTRWIRGNGMRPPH